MLPEIKSKAREKYLVQREEQQLDLFQRRLIDEKSLFKNIRLTSGEEKVQEVNEGILHLGQNKKDAVLQEENYTMQMEDKGQEKKGELKDYMDRYEKEEQVLREGEVWEQE